MTHNNILPFYTSEEKRDHNNWWAFGKIYANPTIMREVPPFQIKRPLGGGDVDVFKLVRKEDGVEFDLLPDADLLGLTTEIFTDQELIVYSGRLRVLNEGIKEGLHYIVISDDVNTWYSEYMAFRKDEDFIKIEYWHNEDFAYDNGYLSYTWPQKGRLYVCSDIGKPRYPYEENVSKRDGRNFPLQQISYKLYRFSFLAPEYLLDAMRLIRLHDNVEITYKGVDFEVDEFLMLDPTWQEQGNLANVDIEFRSSTVALINGRAYKDVDYAPSPGDCLSPIDWTVKAFMLESSDNYSNQEYQDQNGDTIALEEGDYVISDDGAGTTRIREKIGVNLIPVAYSANENVYSEGDDEYFLTGGDYIGKPSISEFDQFYIKGVSYTNSIVQIWGRYQGGPEVRIVDGRSSDFPTPGIKIPFGKDGIVDEIRVKAVSFKCNDLHVTEWFQLPVGIGVAIVENSFIII